MSLSLWPILMSSAVLVSFLSLYLSMKVGFNLLMLIVVIVILNWFKDVGRESDLLMEHSFMNNIFFKTGMILFITSEVMFFVSFFWCYFDFVLVVDIELGSVWPPKGIQSINPFSIPLLNTLILLSSGVLITWSHFSILNNDWFYSVVTLFFTLVLGIYFLCIQFQEYIDATYTFMSSGYGSIFFLATGFHGFHVLLGCVLMSGSLYRMIGLSCDALCHYNFEFSAWYWHFVDVVWLFLFIFIYWWGFYMWILLLYFLISCLIPLIMGIMSLMVSFKMMSVDSFECGFDSSNVSVFPVSLRFFVFCIIFLILDLELIIMSVIPLVMWASGFIVNIVIFLSLVTLSLLMEWLFGSLSWIE